MLYSLRNRTVHCWLSITFTAIAMSSVHAQSVLIPSTTRRDLVFDFSGQKLYISNSTGIVQTFNLSTLTFGTSYDLGGSLNGLDIARDNSFLLVAQNATSGSQGTFHKVDLATGSVTNINYTLAFSETGAWDVAIGSNGLALVTTRFGGSGWVPLRQINLTTNVISIRPDVPGSGGGGEVRQDTQIHRGADGTRLFFMEANTSEGPIFTYSATSNAFGSGINTNAFMDSASGAVNRNGGLMALRTFSSATLYATDFNFVHSFIGIDGGVAFDASVDILYGVNSTTDEIIAYNTQTFAELFRLNIGEDMSAASTQFGTGVLVASADGHWLALETPSGIRVFSIPQTIPTPTPSATPTPTPGGSLLIPSAIRRDMVFDSSGQNLYISNSTGTVRTFNLSALSFGTTYELGGSLNGLDIARDNSLLLVAQNATSGSQGTFHKVDLATGMVTNINYTRAFGETGAWDVKVGSNGLALVTTRFGGSGWTPLRQINLTTNALTIRSDDPGSGGGGQVRQDTQIHHGADGTRLFLMESNISSGPVFTYSATSNTFGSPVNTNAALDFASGAVNRNGSLIALRTFGSPASLNTAPNLNLVHSFNGIDGGVAFDALFDIFYGVNSTTDQIIAYSTETFAELFRLTIGENVSAGSTQFGAGTLLASPDGHWLALETPAGIRL
ncbi:MAG: hypothetical protein QOC70_971, partial [Verrucomicrobiota bacterium]